VSKVTEKKRALKQSAKDRNIPFSLKAKTIRKLLQAKRCYFTGIAFVEIENHPFGRTIDRLDNDKGYIDENVVAVTRYINEKKRNLTLEDIRCIYNGIKHLL